MKFRSKPKIIEAYQITRELLEGCMFDGHAYPKGITLARCSGHLGRREIQSWIGVVVTIHGQARVVEGDWIIREPDGIHFYPCKPDIFAATYEAIQDTPSDCPRSCGQEEENQGERK